MWDTTPRKVLVAVETASSDAVLAYAAQEARRRRCGVHLVHVIGPVTGGGQSLDSLVVLNGMLHHRGRSVLAEAAHQLEDLLLDDDELTVSTELGHGLVVPTLVEASAHACLVLLQHRGMGSGGGDPHLLGDQRHRCSRARSGRGRPGAVASTAGRHRARRHGGGG